MAPALILRDGLLLSLCLGFLMLVTLVRNPRLWLQDAPKEVRDRVPPLSAGEKQERAVLGILFFLILGLILVWTVWSLHLRQGTLGYLTVLGHVYGVLLVFNCFDLLAVDWLIDLVLRPKFLRIPEVEDMPWERVFGSYGYHLRAFCKGLFLILAMSAIIAGMYKGILLFAYLRDR